MATDRVARRAGKNSDNLSKEAWEENKKAGPSRKNTRHPHSAKASRFVVVESKKHELYISSGTYVQMTKIYENIRWKFQSILDF